MDRMYALKTIQETRKLYLELKKDLQEFLTVTRNRSFWLRHYSREYKNKTKRMQLKTI